MGQAERKKKRQIRMYCALIVNIKIPTGVQYANLTVLMAHGSPQRL
jgi:hypothetical protein